MNAIDENGEFWVRRESRSKPGAVYYFNTKTGQSSWKRPPTFKDQAASSVLSSRKRQFQDAEPPRKLTQTDIRTHHTFTPSSSNKSVNRKETDKHEKTKVESNAVTLYDERQGMATSAPMKGSSQSVPTNTAALKENKRKPLNKAVTDNFYKQKNRNIKKKKSSLAVTEIQGAPLIKSPVSSTSSNNSTGTRKLEGGVSSNLTTASSVTSAGYISSDSFCTSIAASRQKTSVNHLLLSSLKDAPHRKDNLNYTRKVNQAELRLQKIQQALTAPQKGNDKMVLSCPTQTSAKSKFSSNCVSVHSCEPSIVRDYPRKMNQFESRMEKLQQTLTAPEKRSKIVPSCPTQTIAESKFSSDCVHELSSGPLILKDSTQKVNEAESRMEEIQQALTAPEKRNSKIVLSCRTQIIAEPKFYSNCVNVPSPEPSVVRLQHLPLEKACKRDAKVAVSLGGPQNLQKQFSERSTSSLKGIKTESCPAASRLKRLQKDIALRVKSVLLSPKKLLNSVPVPTSNSESDKVLLPPYSAFPSDCKTQSCEAPVVETVSSNVSLHLSESISRNQEPVESMEVEYPEWNVLNYINELRKADPLKENYQPSIMELDSEDEVPSKSENHLFYIVLDTNVLLSNLKIIEVLRDSGIPGKGPVILYLPWQVIQELDRIKDNGKINLKILARKAVNFLHDNFSSKHPRVRGQKYDVKQTDVACPDDNILQACLNLFNEGFDMVLFSNDTNLRNKALVNGLSAVSKDELLKMLTEQKDSSISFPKATEPCIPNYEQKKNVNSNETAMFADSVLCELKSNIIKFFSEIVRSGMEKEFGTLWKKRTIVPPPWGADDVLRCLGQHWLSVCGDNGGYNGRQCSERLMEFLKFKTKKYGVALSDVQNAVESTLALYDALPEKYSNISCVGKKLLKDLYDKSRQPLTTTTPDSQNSPPVVSSNFEVSSDFKVSSDFEVSSENKSMAVLLCFERAFRQVCEFCEQKHQSAGDVVWRQKAEEMVSALHTVIECMKVLLTTPNEDLNQQNSAVKCLLHLIKGDTDITEVDLLHFSEVFSTRSLMLNGVQQFINLESALRVSCGM